MDTRSLSATVMCPACSQPIFVPITLAADPPVTGSKAVTLRVLVDETRARAVLADHVNADPAGHATLPPLPVNKTEQFQNAQPFPHIVVDNLFGPNRMRRAAAEFPPADDPRWLTYPDEKERGKRCGGPEMWGPEVQRWFEDAWSPEFVQYIEGITGISPLTPDHVGGGMHMTTEGGRLASHVDFNIHPDHPKLERRINVLLFLNEDWDPEWGGSLLLGENRDVEIVPDFGKVVIFATSDKSWHGHPDPIVGAHERKSLACYFYAPRRESTSTEHSTVWQEAA